MTTRDIEIPQGYAERPFDYEGDLYTEGQMRAVIRTYPAEIARLQSQDREDAERYRWLLGKFQQSYDGEAFEAYSISIYSRMASQLKGDRAIRAEISWRDKTDEPIGLSEAIDHARRVEGEGE